MLDVYMTHKLDPEEVSGYRGLIFTYCIFTVSQQGKTGLPGLPGEPVSPLDAAAFSLLPLRGKDSS